jgi:hypothetical protein
MLQGIHMVSLYNRTFARAFLQFEQAMRFDELARRWRWDVLMLDSAFLLLLVTHASGRVELDLD